MPTCCAAWPRPQGNALQVLLRRGRLGPLRADHGAGGVLPDPHRAGDHGAARGGDGRAAGPALPAHRVRQRQQRQDAPAARPSGGPGRLRADRYLARAPARSAAALAADTRTSRCCRCAPTSRGRSMPAPVPDGPAAGWSTSPARRSATSRRRKRSTCCDGRPGCAAPARHAPGRRSQERPRVLEAAYNDRRGVTAAFNRNLLVRINRELGADFKRISSRTTPSTTPRKAASKCTSSPA